MLGQNGVLDGEAHVPIGGRGTTGLPSDYERYLRNPTQLVEHGTYEGGMLIIF
jgi:hypothetical protein